MRLALSAQRGQTAAELLGVLLVVALIIATIAATDVPGDLRAGTARQICLLVNDARDCPPSAAERDRRERERERRAARRDRDHDGVPDRLERRYGTNPHSADSDGDGVGDAAEIRAGTQRDGPLAQAAQVKKAACIAAQVAATGIDVVTGTVYAGAVVDAICDGIKKGINEVEKRLAPLVKRFCTRSPGPQIGTPIDACKYTIEKLCGLIKKIDRRACDVLKKLACFASELDLFCSKAQKAKKRVDALNALRRKQVVLKFVGGNMRLLGRDALNRATRARANVSRETVRHRRVNKGEGKANTKDVPGWNPKCMDRGHLLARGLGGTGDPRNLVALPREFNQQVMSKLEKQVIDAADSGLDLFVEVEAVYRGTDSVPVAIKYRVVSTGVPKGRKPYNIDPPRTIPVPRPTCR